MLKDVFVRSAFNYDRDAASDETGIDCSVDRVTGEVLVSKTLQSMAEEADINTIVRRFGLTGELPVGLRAPTYGDFTGVFDFHSAMNAVANAGEAFDKMPPAVRARFHNDPGEFVDFCSNEANREEATKLGLVLPVAADIPAAVVVAAPAVTPTNSGAVAPKVLPVAA